MRASGASRLAPGKCHMGRVSHPPPVMLAHVLLPLGNCAQELGKHDDALRHLLTAIRLLDELGDERRTSSRGVGHGVDLRR